EKASSPHKNARRTTRLQQ
ncbi:hypothetical protein SHD_0697, partial [Shewanella decolorationis S12]